MNSANPAPRGESPANIGAGRHEGGKGRQQRRVLPPLRGMANDGILTAGAALPSGYISARAKVVRRDGSLQRLIPRLGGGAAIAS